MEFWEFLCGRYNVTPPNLKKMWWVLSVFFICHRIRCRHGGLVIARVRDDLLYLVLQAFYPNCVYSKPIIHQVHSTSEEEVHQGRGVLEKTGDVLIRVLWESQNEAIIDIRLGDLDCESYKKETIVTLLTWWGKEKNYNNGKHWHEQRKYFFSVLSLLTAFLESRS